MTERQITDVPQGHILTNTRVWSPDGKWLVYDVRSDPAGDKFDGERIEMVNVETGVVKVLYEARNAARCGVATFHPLEPKVVFILGPENPTADWLYNAYHRQGVIVDTRSGRSENLDARDLTPPFTPGALRGGSHVHVWDGAGEWVSFTYEDHVLAAALEESKNQEINLRNVGVSVPGRTVRVKKDHPRNHDGTHFSVLVTETTAHPRPGSDEISRAFEEGWVGTRGYIRPDGRRQIHALAFQGLIRTESGESIAEVFIADLPEDLTQSGERPLAGTGSTRPGPPAGVSQRRLTFTADRKFPGLQGPRHWLRSNPDGSRIAFLMKDDSGVAQLWTVSPNGGQPSQLTTNSVPVASTFSWSPDGNQLAHLMDGSVCVTEFPSGRTTRLTLPVIGQISPRVESCVFSPDGEEIAFVRPVAKGTSVWNQIFVVPAKPSRH
jgi:dipeptidyl aminopeptidase/acylaminoacyl peptidase